MNAAFLRTSQTPKIVQPKLKRYKKDAINYYAPEYTIRKNPEQGC